MKYFISLLLIVSISFSSFGQLKNVNPDKTGEPWILGGFRVPSAEEINKIQRKTRPENYRDKELPTSYDNSTKLYFRPVFSQTDGCCAQASGVAYVYTYESNYMRGTSANTSQNQFPTHYTYNFLNGGSGANGSWMADGWNIIQADGCPTVATYGGLYQDATYWMSGYDNYESGQANRIDELFSIDVNTLEGIETLKHWMYDHLEAADEGSIVSFAAGISNDGYNLTYDNIVTSWGNSVNHAMTFVGWNDNIEYDFNNDGQITTNIDINNDGVVDLKDCERGALIMVNSWGTYWGDGGFAYVMYKLLAEPVENGGIMSNQVFGVTAKENFETTLSAKIKMEHNSRNKVKVSFGIAENISDSEPEQLYNIPLFNLQGGDFDMRGTSSSPIEFTIDITTLLSYIEPEQEAKFFLKIDEQDPYSLGNGQIIDFEITDGTNTWTCSEHNKTITDNGTTLMSIILSPEFDAPEITTDFLETAQAGDYTEYQLEAAGGSVPYKWSIDINYEEQTLSENFPTGINTELTPTSNDDGYAVQELDFSFPYFGEIFDEVVVTTDGSIIFEEAFSYIRTEGAIRNSKVIGVFASDLLISGTTDGIFYSGDSESATFRWKTSLYGDEAANVEAALTIYPDGNLEFFYGDNITPGISWASGISNGKGSSLISEISGDYNPSNTKHQMLPEPFPIGMQISQTGLFYGTVPATGSWIINFKVSDNNNLSSKKAIDFNSALLAVTDRVSDEFNFELNPTAVKTGTYIKYNSDNCSDVFFEVYNISGQKVYSQIIENSSVGSHSFYWNIQNENINAGIYFVRLIRNNKSAVRKIVILN